MPSESSRQVAALFPAPIEHEHEGGHGVPSDASLRAALKAFISSTGDTSSGHAETESRGNGATTRVSSIKGRSGSSGLHTKVSSDFSPGEGASFVCYYHLWRQLRAPSWDRT